MIVAMDQGSVMTLIQGYSSKVKIAVHIMVKELAIVVRAITPNLTYKFEQYFTGLLPWT
jgi:hypothetical protein